MNEVTPKIERWKNIALVLTLINTVFAALLSGLQVDADIRANNANRDSQYYAALASSELVRQGHQSTYDFQTFTTALKASQESLIFEFTSLSLQQGDNASGVENFHNQSVIAQARADAARKFSVLYNDPRYAPDQPDGMPKADIYIADHAEIAKEIVVKQNDASDAYQKWDRKSDSYVAVLTLLAIVFFLLGVSQSTQRMRPFFIVSASVIILVSVTWSVLILIG
jgi:hypothetical protein